MVFHLGKLTKGQSMATIKQRIEALEQFREGCAGELPIIIPDEASDAEIAKLSRNGRQAVRWNDAAELFV